MLDNIDELLQDNVDELSQDTLDELSSDSFNESSLELIPVFGLACQARVFFEDTFLCLVGGHSDTFIMCVHSGSREYYPTWSSGRGQLTSGSCSYSSCQVSLFTRV